MKILQNRAIEMLNWIVKLLSKELCCTLGNTRFENSNRTNITKKSGLAKDLGNVLCCMNRI